MKTIDCPPQCSSFQETLEACKLADKEQCLVRFFPLGNPVFAAPGDNPHVLYKQWVYHMDYWDMGKYVGRPE